MWDKMGTTALSSLVVRVDRSRSVISYASRILCLDGIFALEHAVDLLEVVGAGGDGGNVALGGVILLEMGLLAEIAHLHLSANSSTSHRSGSRGTHLVVGLRGRGGPGGEPGAFLAQGSIQRVDLLDEAGCAAQL